MRCGDKKGDGFIKFTYQIAIDGVEWQKDSGSRPNYLGFNFQGFDWYVVWLAFKFRMKFQHNCCYRHGGSWL